MKKIIALITLTILQFLIVVEMSVVMPFATQFAQTYGISANVASFLNMGYHLFGGLSLFIGYYANKFGIKKGLIVSTVSFALGSLMIIFASSALLFIISRSFIGIGYYAILGLTISYSSQIIAKEKFGMINGVYKVAFGFGVFFSPFLGNYIFEHYSIAMLYTVIFIASLILLITLFFIDEKQESPDDIIDLKALKLLLKNKIVIKAIVSTILLSCPAILFYNYFSVFLTENNYQQITISSLYSLTALGAILAGIIIVVISDKLGKVKTTKIGYILSIIAIVPLFINNYLILLVFTFLFGFGFDTIFGLYMPVLSQLFTKEKSSFLAIITTTLAISNFGLSFIGGIINSLYSFTACIIISCIGLVLSLYIFNNIFKKEIN